MARPRPRLVPPSAWPIPTHVGLPRLPRHQDSRDSKTPENPETPRLPRLLRFPRLPIRRSRRTSSASRRLGHRPDGLGPVSKQRFFEGRHRHRGRPWHVPAGRALRLKLEPSIGLRSQLRPPGFRSQLRPLCRTASYKQLAPETPRLPRILRLQDSRDS